MALLLTYLFLALFISFLCSILEAVILSITPSFIQSLEDKGKATGYRLRKMKADIDRPLSAILTINTIAHTVGASGVGAQAVEVFGKTYFGIISGVLTFMILIFSEIIPKTLGAVYWKKLATFSAHTLRIMIVIAYPLVLLSKVLARMIQGKEKVKQTSNEEVAAIAKIGYEEGILDAQQSKIIANITGLSNIKVQKVMTPRTVMETASQRMSLGEFYESKEKISFSRIPVYNKNVDDISGYVLKHDLLEKLADDRHELRLFDIKRKMEVIYEKTPVLNVFQLLIKNREHIALVVDEYGGVSGLVTMEDIFESLIGLDIVDELDETDNMQQLAIERWRNKMQHIS